MNNPFLNLDRRLKQIEDRQVQILSLIQSKQLDSTYPQRMTIPNAIEYLGGDIPRQTFYSWLRFGKLKAYRVNHRIMIDRVELDAFIKSKREKVNS